MKLNYIIGFTIIIILFSGCIEDKPPKKEYKIIQISKDNQNNYNIIYEYSGLYEPTTKRKISLNTKDDFIIFSNHTKLIDECYNTVGRCWTLYVNNSEIVREKD